jgi:hypothetical protein
MSPKISENLLAEIYVETDDLLKAFQSWSRQRALGCSLPSGRKPRLSASEIAIIVVGYHLSGYKCFEYYYRECILNTYLICPQPNSGRFVCSIIRVLPLGGIMNDIDEGLYTQVNFKNPVSLPASKKYFVSVDMSNLYGSTSTDPLFILSNAD